jgi:hypothetical protein
MTATYGSAAGYPGEGLMEAADGFRSSSFICFPPELLSFGPPMALSTDWCKPSAVPALQTHGFSTMR